MNVSDTEGASDDPSLVLTFTTVITKNRDKPTPSNNTENAWYLINLLISNKPL